MKTFFSISILTIAMLASCQQPTRQTDIQAATDPDAFANVNSEGVILDGYDVVAFFTEGKPVKGAPAFRSDYKGAIYQFASAEHKALFDSDPEKYKVQYGGWCAYAVSLGRIAPIIIDTWSIVDGRLFIQHNERAVRGWKKDVPGNIEKADQYWALVAGNKGRQIVTSEEKGFLVNVDEQKDRLILEGYDPVAYFRENRPVKGNPQFNARVDGATYWFANEENQNEFKDNAEKYKPQYGGFCAYAVSRNRLRPIDPTIFQIVDGRLMLQHSQQADKLFKKDVPGNVQLADGYWPGLVAKKAGKTVKYDKPAK
ncbi:MAG TPA: YHS domain-containing (seleno)protein [Saprospiraceae bacterium]|nr:YHS domain-containing (seleno)protein [Saprospiraceae bacterium]HMP24006.1 YHS domain-containing (seleno)protein [Saprospiraceae bacterium]